MARLYYSDDPENTPDWVLLLVFGVIVLVWWGIIHFVDWLTFDIISWWLEPFTILLAMPFIFLMAEFGVNPLYWWPLVWGTKIRTDSHGFFDLWLKDKISNELGGAKNVYYSEEYIKFRKRSDAINYCLFQKFPGSR